MNLKAGSLMKFVLVLGFLRDPGTVDKLAEHLEDKEGILEKKLWDFYKLLEDAFPGFDEFLQGILEDCEDKEFHPLTISIMGNYFAINSALMTLQKQLEELSEDASDEKRRDLLADIVQYEAMQKAFGLSLLGDEEE